MSSEQALHDRVNLTRLVRRLEKTVASEDWKEVVDKPGRAAWIKAQGTLQKVKYAKKLLKNVELNDEVDGASTSLRGYEDLHNTLDKLEAAVSEVDKRVAPNPTRPAPILPTLPLPVSPSRHDVPDSSQTGAESPAHTSVSAKDLLLSPSDTTVDNFSGPDPSTTLLPPTLPLTGTDVPSKPTKSTTPAFLQNSAAIHEELSEQLAQMATQLKKNTLHFASSLEKDKGVVLEAQEKLERNFDVMSSQRVRLRDHTSKSWGTTWITVLSIVVAIIGFILTFFIIRFT